MTTQLRIVAAVAVVSGLTAAGAVFAEERFGLSALQLDLLRRTR
jgi:energy-converting hydrogenase Eha subunit H